MSTTPADPNTTKKTRGLADDPQSPPATLTGTPSPDGAHSPLPWKAQSAFCRDHPEAMDVADAHGVVIAECGCHGQSGVNAALIVHRVNTYDQLVAAIEIVLARAKEEGWLHYRGTDHEREGFVQLRAALDKAKV